MFYEKFETLCKDRKITPSRAVQEMGFSRALAAKWKHTGDTPRADTLTVIAKYFGVSVADLLGEEKKPAPEGELNKAALLKAVDTMSREDLIEMLNKISKRLTEV